MRRQSRWAIAPMVCACPSRETSRRYITARIVPFGADRGVPRLIEDAAHLTIALGTAGLRLTPFETMIGRASALPDVLPQLRRYLLEYPNAPLANTETFFYGEKVAFGLKPTIRPNHAVVYRGRAEGPRRWRGGDQTVVRDPLLPHRP
jgi:hypothetical protein